MWNVQLYLSVSRIRFTGTVLEDMFEKNSRVWDCVVVYQKINVLLKQHELFIFDNDTIFVLRPFCRRLNVNYTVLITEIIED
jgi:hypothetical protein